MLKKLFQSISNAINSSPQNRVNRHEDEIFIIDFVSIRASGKTIEKAEIKFPVGNEFMMLNGKEKYFNAYYVTNEGLSSDSLYYRIATPKFKFWINPKDLTRFMKVANHRHKMMIEDQKRQEKTIKTDTYVPFDYDQITDEIYECFIAYKSGMSESIGTLEKFNAVESEIATICQEHNGKYYKSKAKTAKYAIIFNPYNRLFSTVNILKEQGYQVTTFEKALLYFGIDHLWDCDVMVQEENKLKELMNK